MANRTFQRRQALESEVKDVYAKVAIGATGAPTISVGYGIASISRTSQGLYRLILSDRYYSLKHFDVTLLAATAEDLTFQIKAEDIDGSTPYIDFYCLAAGSVADPSNGSSLFIKIEAKNTSVK